MLRLLEASALAIVAGALAASRWAQAAPALAQPPQGGKRAADSHAQSSSACLHAAWRIQIMLPGTPQE